MNRKRWKGIIAFVIAAPLVGCAAVVWMIYWQFNGRYDAFEQSLPICRGAEQIFSDFIYNDVQSGFTALYYSTTDSLDNVQTYYENLVIKSANSSPKVILHDKLNDGKTTCYSGPTKFPTCFEVTLMDISQSPSFNLPNILLIRGIANYVPPPKPYQFNNRQIGTLIIYGYYSDEM